MGKKDQKKIMKPNMRFCSNIKCQVVLYSREPGDICPKCGVIGRVVERFALTIGM